MNPVMDSEQGSGDNRGGVNVLRATPEQMRAVLARANANISSHAVWKDPKAAKVELEEDSPQRHGGTEGEQGEVRNSGQGTGDNGGGAGGPVVGDGELCYRVPIALFERMQAVVAEGESVPDLVEELREAREEVARLGAALDQARELGRVASVERAHFEREAKELRAHAEQLQAQLNALVRASQEERAELEGVPFNVARARRGIAPKEVAKAEDGAATKFNPEDVRPTDYLSTRGMSLNAARHLDGLAPLPAVSDGDVDRGAALELLLMAVGSEVREAMGKHARFNSAHEGYAVILEELDELKAEVWKRREARDKARLQDEAVQVAAMAVRFVLDVI